MYKQASKLKLRFETSRGELSVEQLWDLSRNALSIIARNLKKQIKKENDDELSFLDDTATQVDKITQLKFDIVKDIYLTKKAEIEAEQNEVVRKEQLEELLAIKAERQKESIKNLPDDELDKKIAELNK